MLSSVCCVIESALLVLWVFCPTSIAVIFIIHIHIYKSITVIFICLCWETFTASLPSYTIPWQDWEEEVHRVHMLTQIVLQQCTQMASRLFCSLPSCTHVVDNVYQTWCRYIVSMLLPAMLPTNCRRVSHLLQPAMLLTCSRLPYCRHVANAMCLQTHPGLLQLNIIEANRLCAVVWKSINQSIQSIHNNMAMQINMW